MSRQYADAMSRWVGLVVAGCLALAACSDNDDSSTTGTTASQSTPPRTTTEPAPKPKPKPKPKPPVRRNITIAIAGDVHFTERTAALLNDPEQGLQPIAPALSAADLTMVNLESAITTGGVPEPKSFHFRAPATALTALKAAGVDVVSLANNHAVDYGSDGLTDTLAAADNGAIPLVGIGRDATRAYAPHYFTINGHRIAVLAASQVPDETLANWTATADSPGIASANAPELVAAVRTAARRAEAVIVYVHWGAEGSSCPLPEQQQLAQTLADAGATAVVGTHAHLMQGDGWLGSTYVAYGLGNYVWWRDQAYSNDTGVITMTIRDGKVRAAQLAPAYIDSRGLPIPVSSADRPAKLAAFAALRECAGLQATPR